MLIVFCKIDFCGKFFSSDLLLQLAKIEPRRFKDLQTRDNYLNGPLYHFNDFINGIFYNPLVLQVLPLLLFLMSSYFNSSCSNLPRTRQMIFSDEVDNNNKKSSQHYYVYGLNKLIMMMRWFCWHIINLFRFVFSLSFSVWSKFNVCLCVGCCALFMSMYMCMISFYSFYWISLQYKIFWR